MIFRKGSYFLISENCDGEPVTRSSVMRIAEVRYPGKKHCEATVYCMFWSMGSAHCDSRPHMSTLSKRPSQVIRQATKEEIKNYRRHSEMASMPLNKLWGTPEWKQHNSHREIPLHL